MVTSDRFRSSNIDFLNVICCIAVIAMHQDVNDALGLRDALTFAVPVFFMISGATLINYRERYDTKIFLKRRITRAFIPFISWQIIWFLICVILQNKTQFLSVYGIIDGFINCNFNRALWFFYPLFLLYFLIPSISLISDNKKNLTELALLIVFIESLAIPILKTFKIDIPDVLINGVGLPVMYALLGYLLFNISIKKNGRVLIYISSLLLITFRWFMQYKHPGILYCSLTDPYTLFEAVAIFIAAKNINFSPKISKILGSLSQYSLGIYLIHYAVIFAEKRLLGELLDITNPHLFVPFVLTTYFISIVSVHCIKQIPYIGNKIV